MSVIRSPRVALGVTALAGLTALGGVGIAMSNDGAAVNGAGASRMSITGVATTSTKPKSSSSSPTSTDAPSTGGASGQLYNLLPAGFDSNNCSPSTDSPPPGATADLVCGSNSLGPARGEFVLFSDQASMKQTFQSWVGEEDSTSPCTGFKASPADWFYDSNKSDNPSGQLACGMFKGKSDLIWTENDTMMLGNISGGTIDSLTAYWKNPGAASGGGNRS